ncbi:MAG: hypothetical protein PWQ43_253 [Rikenellaceae bacterium]|nr:hypothetical protein [Rikenellaceae bacterium]
MNLKSLYFIIIFLIFSFVLKSQDKLLNLKDVKITLKNNVALIVNQPSSNGIVATGNGGIVSEGDLNKVVWKINNNTGTYTIPFWKTSRIDLVYQITTAGSSPGALIASTRGTGADNTPLPTVAPAVEDLNINGTNGSYYVVDRYWILRKDGWSTNPDATLSFKYQDNEIAPPNTISETNLSAQLWGQDPYAPPGTYSWVPDAFDVFQGFSTALGTADAANNRVTNVVPPAGYQGGFYTWILVDKAHPLPVTLLYFKVYCVGKYVALKWETASEINCDYYLVERSSDGISWEPVAYIQGAGNSNEVSTYSWADNFDSNGSALYYRLTQFDYDGEYEVLGIQSILCNAADDDSWITINTDIFNNILINFTATEGEPYEIKVFNLLGELMYFQSGNVANSIEQFVISTYGWTSSIYLVDVRSSLVNKTQKVYIQEMDY